MASSDPKANKQGASNEQRQSDDSNIKSDEKDKMLSTSLYSVTGGLPQKELRTMVAEAIECEKELEEEIRQLENALENPESISASVQTMLDSELAPPDKFFTISALLGRLREDLATPLPPNSTLPALRAGLNPPKKKQKKEDGRLSPFPKDLSPLEKQKQLLAIQSNPEYAKEHVQSTTLMALWKKISSHRTSIVFRRPVNPKEAPGYTERISFPMDLSLIRKMIVARQIKSYKDLHQRIGLICHNCLKYNGRESDYGVVTRNFEAKADEMIVAAVLTSKQAASTPNAQVAPEKDGNTESVHQSSSSGSKDKESKKEVPTSKDAIKNQ